MRRRERWRGNRRLRRGYCPLCSSSPPDPACRVCKGSRDYGPYQSHDTAENWWVAWHRIIGFPTPTTKGLVEGRGVAPTTPPPPMTIGCRLGVHEPCRAEGCECSCHGAGYEQSRGGAE